jgi:hypothetical protein
VTSSNRYTVLGWLVWKIAKLVARRKLARSRPKLIAAATVVLVIAAGIALTGDSDE